MDLPTNAQNTKNVVKKVLITPEQIAKLGLTAKIRSVVAPQLKQKINSKPVTIKKQNVSDNKLLKNQDKQTQDEMTLKIKNRLKKLIGTKLSAPSQIDNDKEKSKNILLNKPSRSTIILNNMLDKKNTIHKQISNQEVKEKKKTNQCNEFSLNKPMSNQTQTLSDMSTAISLEQKNNEELRAKVTIFQNETVRLNKSTVKNLLKTQKESAITSKEVITLHANQKLGSIMLNQKQKKPIPSEENGTLPSIVSPEKATTGNNNSSCDIFMTMITKTKETSTKNLKSKEMMENDLENNISCKELTSAINCTNNDFESCAVKHTGLLSNCSINSNKNIELQVLTTSDDNKNSNRCSENKSLNKTSECQINSTESEINLTQTEMLVDAIKDGSESEKKIMQSQILVDAVQEEQDILKKKISHIVDISKVTQISKGKPQNNYNNNTKFKTDTINKQSDLKAQVGLNVECSMSDKQEDNTSDISDKNTNHSDNIIKSDSESDLTENKNKTHHEHFSEVDKKKYYNQTENINCHIVKGLNKDKMVEKEQPISIIHKSIDENLKTIDDICKQNENVEDILGNNLKRIETISKHNENMDEGKESTVNNYEEIILNVVDTKKKATKWKSIMLEQSNYDFNKEPSESNEENSLSILYKKTNISDNTCIENVTNIKHVDHTIQLDTSSININQVSTINSCENKQIANTSNNEEVTKLPISFEKKKRATKKENLANEDLCIPDKSTHYLENDISIEKNKTKAPKIAKIVDASNDILFTPEIEICKVITSTPKENSKINFNVDVSDSSINKTPSIKRGRMKLKDVQEERINSLKNLERPKRATKVPKRFLDDALKKKKDEMLFENQNNYPKTRGCKRKLSKHYTIEDLHETELPGAAQLSEISLENKEKVQKREMESIILLNKQNLNTENINDDIDLPEIISNIVEIKKDLKVTSNTLLEKDKSDILLSTDNIDSLNNRDIDENIVMKGDKQVVLQNRVQICKSNYKNNNEIITNKINENVDMKSMKSLNQLQSSTVPGSNIPMVKLEGISSEGKERDDNSKPVTAKRRGRPPKNSKNRTNKSKLSSDKSIEDIAISNKNLNSSGKEIEQEKIVHKSKIEEDKVNNKSIEDISNKNFGIYCKEDMVVKKKIEISQEDNSNIKISPSNHEMRNNKEIAGEEIEDSSANKDVTHINKKNETCTQNVPDITEKKKRGRPSKSSKTIEIPPDLGKRKTEKVDYVSLDGNVECNEFVKKRRVNKRISENVSNEEGFINPLSIVKEVSYNNVIISQGAVKRKRGRPSKADLGKDKNGESKIEIESSPEDFSSNVSKTDKTITAPDLEIKNEQFNNLSLDDDVDEFIRKLHINQKLLYAELQTKIAGPRDGKSPLEIHQAILVTAFAADMREEMERCRIIKLKQIPASIKKSGKNITCAVCYEDLPNSSWTIHRKRFHNNLAWKVGETPIDFTNATLVMYILNQFYKDRKPLYCSTCSESKKSPIGFLCHKMQCNKSTEILEDMKMSCNICDKLIMPFSFIEHMKGHKTKENKQQRIQENNHVEETEVSGKRSAAVRASRIIQDALKDSVATTSKSIKKLYTRSNTTDKYDESKIIENITKHGFTKCDAEECGKEIKTTKEAQDHFNKCEFIKKKTYICKNCDYISNIKDEICSHIETQHKDLLPPEIAEYNLTSDEDTSSISLQKRSHNKTVTTGKLYQFRFLSEITHVHDFSQHINKLTFSKTLDFCRKNYESTLHMNLSFNKTNWKPLDAEQIIDYLPILKKSLPVEQEQTKSISFDKKNLKNANRYKLFESTIIENGTSTIFCGGPISSMAWLPTPIDNESCNQILAISVLPDFNKKYHILRQHSGKNTVQFWNYGCLSNKNLSTFKPKLEFCLAHECGVIWTMEWCPSGCFNKERMGLLAISSSDSNVYVYSVCHQNQLSSTVYKVKPVLKLSLERKSDLNLGGVPYQATRISWSKAKGHRYICVGFSNGIIALFNLESSSELLRDVNDDVNIIYPCLVFQAHQSMITGISLYHLNNGKRWLATSSSDRQIKFWDLENVAEPLSRNVRYPVSGIVWLNNWLCTIDAHDDVTNCIYQATSISHVKEFLHGNSIINSNSPVNAISGSNWSNIIVQGNVMGEVIGCYLKQLAPLNTEPNICRYYMSYTKLGHKSSSTSADSITIDDPSRISTYKNASKNHGLIFCDLNLKNYDIVHNSKIPTGHRGKYQDYNLFSYPLQSISSIEINPNRYTYLFTAVGYQAGFVKLLHSKFLS